MSVINDEMVKEYAAHFNIDLADGSQRPGIEGTLASWEKGEGELVADLVDRETFLPLKEAYFAAIAARNDGVQAEAPAEDASKLPPEEQATT